MKYAGADWIESDLRKPLSPLGRKVADILGQTFAGIYHLRMETLQRVDWSNEHHIEIQGHGGYLGCLGTWDGNELTTLVILCHDAAIRLEISPCLVPWKDTTDDGSDNEPALGLAHAVRCEGFEPDDILGTPGLHLLFTQRTREGRGMTRHPTMEESLERARRLGVVMKEAHR